MPFSAAKSLQHQIAMLSGDEHEFRGRALAEIVALASIDGGDFDREEFDAGSSPPIDWFSSAGTAPFLSERRVAIVRRLLRRDPADVKIEALPASALLILVADDESGDDGRQQRLKKVRVEWEKRVKAAGGYVETFEAESKDARRAVKAEADALGKKISDAAASALIEMTGFKISRAIEELRKLAIFVGGKPEIREADVRVAVVPAREWNVFRLVDSLLSGQEGEALRQLRVLVGSQNKAEDSAMRNILPQMSRNLRLIWQARLCVEAKAPLENLPPSTLAMLPERNNLLKEQPWVQTKILRIARAVDLDQIARCLEIVAQTDARMKGLLDAYSPMDTLERMALEIADAVRAPRTRYVR